MENTHAVGLARKGIQVRTIFTLCAIVLFIAPVFADSLDADSLASLVGYTIVAASTVKGDFEGADFDKLVSLDNGMIFEFQEYSYSYSYRPTAVVLARSVTAGTRAVTLYKLVVEDEIYDVVRVR